MKLILVSIIVFLTFKVSLAQNTGELRGRVVDENNLPRDKSTVSIVSLRDSIVLSYTLTDAKGKFSLLKLPVQQELMLHITHVNSDPFSQKIILSPKEILDLDSIIMTSGRNIDEVLISHVAPIRLKGDTLEFKADYFKTRPNATVEELLQRLPGLQVNMDGSLIYQGRYISGIRVNNKDFFTQDLTIATKNLDASLIDVVQIIKDKGESKREIIDDSELPIVLNLKTKKEFVNANFGKFYGGGGTRDRYETGALVNTFRDTLQISFIGFGNNMNRQGFDYSELREYGGMNRQENSSYTSWGSNGLLNSISAGVNVNYDVKNKLKVNLNYNYAQRIFYDKSMSNSVSYYNTVEESAHNESENKNSHHEHSAVFFARYILDSTSMISLNSRLNLMNSLSTNNGMGDRYREGNVPVQNSTNSSSYQSNNSNYTQTIAFEKKFRNKWLLSANTNLDIKLGIENNENFNFTALYVDNKEIIDQSTITDEDSKTTATRNTVNIQIPIFKNSSLDFFAKHIWEKILQEEDILHKLNTSDYVNREDAANNIQLNALYTYFGSKMNTRLFKIFNLSAGLQYLNLDRTYDYYDRIDNISTQQKYWLPDFSLSFKGWNLNYTKNIRLPYFFYLRAVDVNLSPTYYTYSSPYFDNTEEERYTLRYAIFLKKLKMNFNFYANYSKESNSIANDRTYDISTLKSTSRNYQSNPVNRANYNMNISKSFKDTKTWKILWTFSTHVFMNENYSILNFDENISTSYRYNATNTLKISFKDQITFTPSYTIGFSETKNSLNSADFHDFSDIEHNFGSSFLVNNFYKFRLEGSYNIKNLRKNLQNDRDYLNIVNASIYYPILRKGELKFTAFDVLNQNKNVFANSFGNANTYYATETLRQYFLIGLVYKFLKTETKKSQK